MIKNFSRFVLLAALSVAGISAQVDDATRRQYDEIVNRQHVGGRITAEERAFLMKVYAQSHPPRDSTGMVALSDLRTGAYQGEQGGLYPGGQNTPPAEHLKAGLEMARKIVPLDGEGRAAPDGKIVLLSIGMSNTTMEYQTFMKRAAEDKELNPRLVLVDGAQGGQSALETSDPQSNFWKVVDQRISAAGVTARQVQAAWMFQVVVTPQRPFPLDVRRLQSLMLDTLRCANDRFPNLKIAYLSSRIYAGYAAVPQNPEPHSYESGFAPKWIIAGQIAGYMEYNCDPSRGRVRLPWVAWGPYMWADGVKGRKDGLTWVREDFGVDGMHPSMQGREKVAKMLLQFLKTDPTSKPWFLAEGQGQAQAIIDRIKMKLSGQWYRAQGQTASAISAGSEPQRTPAQLPDLNAIRGKVQSGQPLTAEEKQLVQQARQRQASAQGPAPDMSELRRKVQSGQQLTPEETQRLQQANAQQMQQRRQQYMKEHPPQSSLGLVPLTDLGTGAYKGEQGGLYPGGKNEAPPEHLKAGLKLAGEVVPLDGDGRRSPDGKIVLLSVGFSNPNIEFPAFQRLVAEDRAINPRLVTVNGCVGAQASSQQADPNSNYWKIVDQRLDAAGVTLRQVQALWIKEVIPGTSQPFPEESKKLSSDLVATLHVVHDRFPNLKVAYLSSRTYGGYTEVGGSPEPWAYETGFSVKWVVSGQIAGKPEVNYDPAKGAVRSPWIAWGPYLWTDGGKARKDGFVYLREDLREDGLHPSEKGSAKIATLMMNFFKTDPTTRSWFLK